MPRSGSTLLQRVLNATGQIIISGETGGLLATLSRTWSDIERHVRANLLSGTWEQVAAHRWKFPAWWQAAPPDRQLHALRQFCFEFLGGSAERRWGVKEIRLCRTARDGARELGFLRVLFPGATFLFLTRNAEEVRRSMAKKPDWWTPSEIEGVSRQREALLKLAPEFGAIEAQYSDLIDFARATALLDCLGLTIAEEDYRRVLAVNVS